MQNDDQVDELFAEEEQGGAQERNSDSEPSMEHWEDLESALSPKAVERGDIVEAVVAEVQDQAVIVDLGTKYEGFIPRNEFAQEQELPAVGETIQVAVMNVEEKNERIRVSKRRADYERVWTKLQQAHEDKTVLKAMVTERVKGGLRADVGVSGFVPASQVVVRDVRTLERFVGRTLPLRVMEIDRRRNKVVLSHKQAVEEERQMRREKTLARLYEGAVCEGRVVSLTDYGAFIDLGGLDGLLHISELAWHHVNHPAEVLEKGSIVRVMVLAIEEGGGRISLSRRELLPDPWKEVSEHHQVGDNVDVEITRVVATGAFARPADLELEGFIPLRELSSQRLRRADEAVSSGQKLEAKIIELQPQARKMTLSITQAGAQRERAEIAGYLTTSEGGTRINLGEQFGDILRDAKAALDEEPGAEAVPASESAPPPESGPEPETGSALAPQSAGEEQSEPQDPAEEGAGEEQS